MSRRRNVENYKNFNNYNSNSDFNPPSSGGGSCDPSNNVGEAYNPECGIDVWSKDPKRWGQCWDGTCSNCPPDLTGPNCTKVATKECRDVEGKNRCWDCNPKTGCHPDNNGWWRKDTCNHYCTN